MKRGEIYWVNLDPTVGSEIKKTRPAVVVSNDLNNIHAQTVTVLPLSTSVDKVYPFEVLLKSGVYGNKEPSKVKANQIRTIDKQRLGQWIGLLPKEVMVEMDKAMRLHLDL
ncbi:MAG: type II toxin-antitoxin system PemK/MazF family toxin [Elusimicrobia bacterium]|nr:type II toxin-antitoxin system PemK/MazF family toxin [Elusimicrobiota bacterium]